MVRVRFLNVAFQTFSPFQHAVQLPHRNLVNLRVNGAIILHSDSASNCNYITGDSVGSELLSLNNINKRQQQESSSTFATTTTTARMPRGVKKENLPSKVCVVCGRPFTWRKKWETVWDEVTTCSKSCNRKRKERATAERKAAQISIPNDDFTSDTFLEMGNKEKCDGFHMEQLSDEISCLKTECVSKSRIKASGASKDILEVDEHDILQQIRATNQEGGNKPVSEDDGSTKSSSVDEELDPVALRKAERKAEKKRKKQQRRAQREGRGDKSAGQKQCDMCSKSVDLLIRCTYDESQQWKMVCGKCWEKASGGVVDGDAKHPYYRYGGLWKNRRAQK